MLLLCVAVVVCLLPAWASNPGEPIDAIEKFVESDAPVFPEVPADKALLYILRIEPKPKSQMKKSLHPGGRALLPIFLNQDPLSYLPKQTYITTTVVPGEHVLWGDVAAQKFDFKAGRTYVLIFVPAESEVEPRNKLYSGFRRWAVGDPATVHDKVTSLELTHVTVSEKGLEALRDEKAFKRYDRVVELTQNIEWQVTLPNEFSSMFHRPKVKKPERCGGLEGRTFSKGGKLTVDREQVLYEREKTETTIEIPTDQIQGVEAAGECIKIRYAIGDEWQDVFFWPAFSYVADLSSSGIVNSQSLIIWTILEARDSRP
jgi:hypothetical protein